MGRAPWTGPCPYPRYTASSVGVGLMVALRVSLTRALPGPGKGLAEAPAVIPDKALAGGLVVFLGWDPAKGRHLLLYVSYLECLHKDLHATMGMSPESLPHGGSGLKGDLLHRRGASRRGKGLAGVAKAVSRQGSCRGSPLRPLCSSWSWPWHRSSSLELRSYPGSPPLPCLVWWCPRL